MQPQTNQTMVKLRHFSLRHNRVGATLIELMAMLLIVSMALSALFYALTQSITFARDTEARVKAIALAREGIEAMYNIRNTNWLRFSSDRTSCWNVWNYQVSCIGEKTMNQKIDKGSYRLHQENGLWKLGKFSSGGTWSGQDFHASAQKFQIGIDENGWYSASGGYDKSVFCNNINRITNCRSMFSREILVEKVLNDDGDETITEDKSATKMQVRSSVYWYSGGPKKVELVADITNWKARYDENK